ncbi:MAG: hypothetical protein Q4B42_07995 [Oscillospiraceae bacterium]|nr:hypothetical protein [Oscillospiraceae bacterium]
MNKRLIIRSAFGLIFCLVFVALTLLAPKYAARLADEGLLPSAIEADRYSPREGVLEPRGLAFKAARALYISSVHSIPAEIPLASELAQTDMQPELDALKAAGVVPENCGLEGSEAENVCYLTLDPLTRLATFVAWYGRNQDTGEEILVDTNELIYSYIGYLGLQNVTDWSRTEAPGGVYLYSPATRVCIFSSSMGELARHVQALSRSPQEMALELERAGGYSQTAD